MFNGQKNFWFGHALLLVALAAGGLMTQLVPTYQDVAARTKAAVRVSPSKASSSSSSDVSGIDANLRHLAVVSSIS